MLKNIIALHILLLPCLLFGQLEGYQCHINLNQTQNDKLTVTVNLPKQSSRNVEFRFPAIVPGTYSVYNFGRFISNLKAYNDKNELLSVSRVDTNGWSIENASSLSKVVYDVEDTWDTAIKENFIFEPAGTNIDSAKQYVLNTFGFIGYLKGQRNLPYQLTVSKPKGFYASTGAQNLVSSADTDILEFDNYDDLADSPIMYCLPDTTWLNVGGTQVLVSVYSPTQKVNSKQISQSIFKVLDAQRKFLGGALPVKKYAFIINLFTGFFNRSGSYGALEHSYSSFYFLPEMSQDLLASTVSNIAAHEFFHIVTPLNIHSEEIHNFDFDKPEMSAHLWLYEGVTEYFSYLVQVQNGLIHKSAFYDDIHDKITEANHYNDTLAFTAMSKDVLGIYADQYGNVYAKGALIAMCLDIKLRDLSGGKHGLQNLMVDLAGKYGKNRPFKDSQLFTEITKLTYPEIGDFLRTYVSGNKPLPLADILALVGVYIHTKAPASILSFDGYHSYLDEHGKWYVQGGDEIGSVHLLPGDEIVAINGDKINYEALEILKKQIAETGEKEALVTIAINRIVNGVAKKQEYKCTARLIPTGGVSPLIDYANTTTKQLSIRRAWLGL